MRTIYLTATPFRGDGVSIDAPLVYSFSLSQAIAHRCYLTYRNTALTVEEITYDPLDLTWQLLVHSLCLLSIGSGM